MSFPLPLPGTPAREALGDIAAFAALVSPENRAKVPTMRQALRQGREAVASDPAIAAVCYVCLRADTAEFWLIRIGKRGGWKRLWNFGTGCAS